MSEENLPPIPEQVPQEQQTSIVWGVLAIVGSLFCWIVGLVFSVAFGLLWFYGMIKKIKDKPNE